MALFVDGGFERGVSACGGVLLSRIERVGSGGGTVRIRRGSVDLWDNWVGLIEEEDAGVGGVAGELVFQQGHGDEREHG